MSRLFALIVLVLAASLTPSCGSGRRLQSISISQTANGQEIEFVATGTFSAAPITVSPLAVQWTIGLYAPPPANLQYQLTTQPFVFDCTGSGPYLPIVAAAPSNPRAPGSGTLPFKAMVTASVAVNCP